MRGETMSAIPRLSPSIASVLLDRSAAHAWQAHRLLGGGLREESSPAMEKGKILEILLGLGDIKKLVVVDAKDWRTKVAQEAREVAEMEGRTPVLAAKYTEYEAAAESIIERLAAKKVHMVGATQVRLEWQSQPMDARAAKGVACSGVADLIQSEGGKCLISDLKIVDNAHPDALARNMVTMGRDLQAAAYVEAWEMLHPQDAGRTEFRLICCEAKPPYAATIAYLDGSFIELGRRRWGRAVQEWGLCLATNRWPDYSHDFVRLSPLGWQLSQEEGASMTQTEESQ